MSDNETPEVQAYREVTRSEQELLRELLESAAFKVYHPAQDRQGPRHVPGVLLEL